MILAIDIGNSNLVLGCFDDRWIVFTERVSTDLKKTELEYAIVLKAVLELHGAAPQDLEGAVISSVVPPLVPILKNAIEKISPEIHPLIVDQHIRTGLPIHLDHPEQVGNNLIVDAVAASTEYGNPVIVIDFGTATTLSVIDRGGCYVGGAILPGVQVSLDSLVAGTAQLPNISLTEPSRVLAKNTVDSMKSGILYGNAAAIDGMIDRICEELRGDASLVATGDLAETVIPCCCHEITIDKTLPLKGLRILYEMNKGGAAK